MTDKKTLAKKTEILIIMKDTGEKIYGLRKAKGLSQGQLAELIGVSRQTIYKWEAGHARPTSENVKALSDVLGVDEAYFSGVDTNNRKEEKASPEYPPIADKPRKRGLFAILSLSNAIALSLALFATVSLKIISNARDTGEVRETAGLFGRSVFAVMLAVTVLLFLQEAALVFLAIRKSKSNANRM